MAEGARSPFRIATPERATMGGAPIDDVEAGGTPLERVEQMVQSSNIFVFLKGTPEQPRCGFSANTVAMLESVGARY
jgi:monothiol glutaredoxin